MNHVEASLFHLCCIHVELEHPSGTVNVLHQPGSDNVNFNATERPKVRFDALLDLIVLFGNLGERALVIL